MAISALVSFDVQLHKAFSVISRWDMPAAVNYLKKVDRCLRYGEMNSY
jgi:hypothetical protein